MASELGNTSGTTFAVTPVTIGGLLKWQMSPLIDSSSMLFNQQGGTQGVPSFTNIDYMFPSEELKKKYPNLYGDALLDILKKPLGITRPLGGSEVDPNKKSNTFAINFNKENFGKALGYMGYAANALSNMGLMTGNKTLTALGTLGSGITNGYLQYQNWGNQIKESQDNISSLTKGLAGKNGTELKKLQQLIKDALNKLSLLLSAQGMSVIGAASDTARNMFFLDLAMNDSALTGGINLGYDAVANAAMMFGPIGTIVGGAMKLGALTGDLVQSIGGGTDQMTTTDQLMDSSLFSWNIGMINGFGGSRTLKFAVNQDTLAKVGSDYGGSVLDINNAASLADKKYGLLSSGARRDANNKIDNARRFQNSMTNIANTAEDLRLSAQSIALQNITRYLLQLNGSEYNYYLNAKHGAKLPIIIDWEPVIETWEPEIVEFRAGGIIEWEPVYKLGEDTWEPTLFEEEWNPIISFKSGGSLENDDYNKFLESLPDNLKNSSDYRMERYWELGGKPKDFKEALTKEEPLFVWDKKDKCYYANTIAWNENGEGEFMKSPKHPSIGEELKWYYSDEALDFRNKYDLDLSGPYWKYILKLTTKLFKEGGEIKEEEESLTEQKNVIPDGALHKNKHHMENAEGLTKKGIPVIDNNGEQLAEIELNEIIFSLEVTKKLELLSKVFYDSETSNKEKDEAAVEAGRLLVLEILFNTEDNTGLIDTLKNGGKINEL